MDVSAAETQIDVWNAVRNDQKHGDARGHESKQKRCQNQADPELKGTRDWG
jgi:hypothetical protein